MTESVRLRPETERDLRVVIGVVSILYIVGLAVFLLVGPFLVSGVSSLSLGSAFEVVVGVVGVGYALAGLLLLR